MWSRMIFYFGLLFVAVVVAFVLAELFGIPFTTIAGEREKLETTVFQNLTLVADLKEERLLRWLEERRGDSTVLAESRTVKAQLAKLRTVVEQNTARGLVGEELWAKVRESTSYQALTEHLSLVKSTHGVYEEIHVADASTRIIIASTHEPDLGLSVAGEEFFKKDLMPGGNPTFILGKHPQRGGFDLFTLDAIGTPGTDSDGGVGGVLIMDIRLGDMVEPILHTGEGLGETGEVVLVDDESRILVTPRFPLPGGVEAEILGYRISAEPASLAARGEEGMIVTLDYRDELVLAVFRHIPVSSEFGWGMVVKRDQAEVYGFLRQAIIRDIFVGLVAILIALGLTYLIASRLSRPIRALSRAAEAVEAGDLDTRVPITTSDEVGALATTFNSMVQRLQSWYRELEEQVQGRTQELRSANEVLRGEIVERRRAEEEVRSLGRELEQRVIERTAELEAANKELGSFSYSVAHDLRAPLRAMDGFSRILAEEHATQLSEQAQHYLVMVRENALHMGRLVDDLLRLSGLGRQVIRKQRVMPAVLVRQALEDLSGEQEGRQVEITIGDLPECEADPALLKLAFVNLLDNALKFTRKRDVAVIQIGSQVSGDKTSENIYFVKDNGVGFDMQYVDKLFGVFQRLHSAEEYKGTGVGLAIVQRIITRHGGRVWGEAEIDKGATVYFTLEGGYSNGSNG